MELLTQRVARASSNCLTGKRLGGYMIERCVGSGGMGVVYEARRASDGATVALKMMKHRLRWRPEAVARFRRESEALRGLRHRGVVRGHDRFVAYCTQCLVMDYCDGLTLRQLLRQRSCLSEADVRGIAGQLASVLDYLHTRGWTHRDIKPSNVMIAASGVDKLLDFGLARTGVETVREPFEATRSSSHSCVGTPQYMAPEQFSFEPVDFRVDIYALACVVYEALTGRPVAPAGELFEIIDHKLAFELPRACEVGSGVTNEMHSFLANGLAPWPESRTVSLAQIACWANAVVVAPSAGEAEDIDSQADAITWPVSATSPASTSLSLCE